MVMGILRGRAGTAALLCAALALASQDAAIAQNRATDASPRTLRREIAAADRDLRALQTRAEAITAEAHVLRAEATALHDRLAALEGQQDAATAARITDRDAVEALVIAQIFAQRGGRDARRAGATAQLISADAVSRAAQRRREADALAQERAALAAAQDALVARNTALQAQLASLQTDISAQQAQRTQLAADLRAAERRVADAAAARRRARTQQASAQRPQRAPAAAIAASSLRPILSPARADVVRQYGETAAAGLRAQGVTLRTAPGAAVVAPADGEVAYSGPFRGYGDVLILNLSGGHALVLTGMDSVRAQTGARISAGQTVGVMSSTVTSPELYVEVRRDGQPVDPGRWLAATQTANRRTG
ncbi:MAG: peptidoglycan DD-metalloendopeptidase family protein [Alphaproteobacteria bacterium]|nr:peptidoglycan DD-metalloendopeptidase family protein [Alphaproteobacteria bacterium]